MDLSDDFDFERYQQRCSFCGARNDGQHPYCSNCQSELPYAEGISGDPEPFIAEIPGGPSSDVVEMAHFASTQKEDEVHKDFRSAITEAFGEESIDYLERGHANLQVGKQYIGLSLNPKTRMIDTSFGSEKAKEESTKHTVASWDYAAKKLQAGSVDFAHKFKDFLGSAAKYALGISYIATEKRAKVYAKMLERAGFKQIGKIEGKEASVHEWQPEIPEVIPVEDDEIELAKGGKVPVDPTKVSNPGDKDKVPAKLEPGEVVIPKDEADAIRSLITTGASGLDRGAVAKSPMGSGVSGLLGDSALHMATGGEVPDTGGTTAVYHSPDASIAQRMISQYLWKAQQAQLRAEELASSGDYRREARYRNLSKEYAVTAEGMRVGVPGRDALHNPEGITSELASASTSGGEVPHGRGQAQDQANEIRAHYAGNIGLAMAPAAYADSIAKSPSQGMLTPPSGEVAHGRGQARDQADEIRAHYAGNRGLALAPEYYRSGVAKSPAGSPSLLGGQIDAQGNTIPASGDIDMSLGVDEVSGFAGSGGETSESASGRGVRGGFSGASQQAAMAGSLSSSQSAGLLRGGRSRRGVAKSPRYLGAIGDIFSGIAGSGISSGHLDKLFGGGRHSRMEGMSGLLGQGGGGLTDLIGSGGGGVGEIGGQNELLEVLRDLTDAIKKLTEKMGDDSGAEIGPPEYLAAHGKGSTAAQATPAPSATQAPDHSSLRRVVDSLVSNLMGRT